ncbi:Hypothetical protein CINCED_3A009021 [Cinara cedri]|nr:Hypothetical protein CINCED_3A009021 [Cinara cedri]
MLSLNEEMLYNDGIKNSTILFQSSSSKTERLVLEPHHMEINLPYMITCLKKSTPNFPVSHFHKYMKKKCLLAKQSTTNIEPLWIDKYKPMCEEEVLGNSELVKRLKKWLKPIKEKSKKCKTYDSDDNYVFASDGDSDSNSKVQVHHNLAILLGPSGCGKTSAVYAVANELNANVIELNASCNRNGKRIITDLMEATQSHAVEKNCLFNMIKEKSKKHKNLKGKKEMNEKMTIILIEDADILFENHDDGYLSAISTLATDSKRPFILTANDSFSNNLLKFFVSSKMVLNFVYPPKQHLNCFLQLMALNEGVIMSEDEIKTFIHPLKPDVRQSTLQLQYILNTGEIANRTLNNTYIRCINSAWWNWPYVLGYDSINIENDKQAKCNINMATICENLDVLSKLNLINAKTQSCNFLDPQPFWHHIAIRDSSSLIETNHWSDNTVQLSTDIFDWIYNHINTRDYNCDKLYPTPEDLSHRQRMWNISNDLVEQIGLDFCNRKNETCFDYMATIRSLSKNQQVNQPFSNLRQSKMFSYLRRINIEVDSNELKHFCDSFQSNSNCYQPVNQSDQL